MDVLLCEGLGLGPMPAVADPSPAARSSVCVSVFVYVCAHHTYVGHSIRRAKHAIGILSPPRNAIRGSPPAGADLSSADWRQELWRRRRGQPSQRPLRSQRILEFRFAGRNLGGRRDGQPCVRAAERDGRAAPERQPGSILSVSDSVSDSESMRAVHGERCFPHRYEDLYTMYKKAVASFWSVEEVDLSADLRDWDRLSGAVSSRHTP